MTIAEIFSAGVNAILVLLGILITSYFGSRISTLEGVVETLRKERDEDQIYILKLINAIYRGHRTPPEREN